MENVKKYVGNMKKCVVVGIKSSRGANRHLHLSLYIKVIKGLRKIPREASRQDSKDMKRDLYFLA